MLVFCVMRAAAGQPHRVRRLVLLSPAGFHDVIPWLWWPFIFVLPYWHRLLAFLLGKDRACECGCWLVGLLCLCCGWCGRGHVPATMSQASRPEKRIGRQLTGTASSAAICLTTTPWPAVLSPPKTLHPIHTPPKTDHPALLPTYAARGFFFSGLLELARLPAMADFTRAAMSTFFGGDASQWEQALLMPHYSASGMPACSLHQVCACVFIVYRVFVWLCVHCVLLYKMMSRDTLCCRCCRPLTLDVSPAAAVAVPIPSNTLSHICMQALHFIQIIHSGRFQLFDYGSRAANMGE